MYIFGSNLVLQMVLDFGLIMSNVLEPKKILINAQLAYTELLIKINVFFLHRLHIHILALDYKVVKLRHLQTEC